MRRLATPTRLFVAGFLLLQLAWIAVVPPFAASDEFDHAFRASGVAGGQLVADEVPEDGRGLLVAVTPDIAESAHEQCDVLTYPGPDNCTPVGPARDGRVLIASGAANYHPAYYAVVGTAGRLAEGSASLYVMRVASALLCLVLIGLAAWSASRARGPWPLAGLAVALTPVLVYSTTVVAPNGLEMAAGAALWASLLRLRVEPDPGVGRRLLLVAILAASVLCTVRLLGPLWVLLAVGVVTAFDPVGTWTAVRRHLRLVVGGVVVVLLATIDFVVWQRIASATANPDGVGNTDVNPLWIVVWMMQSVAAFPYRNQFGPAVVYAVVGVVVVGLLVLASRSVRGRARAVLWAAAAATVVLPVVATALTWDSRGLIWQGRYGLPFSLGVVLLAAQAVSERDRPPRLSRLTVTIAAAAYAVAIAACLLKVRHDELTDNPASAADPSWHVPPAALVVVLVLAGVTLAVAATVATQDRRLPQEATDGS